jgi:transcriptional regulator with XRE-family HTH domain
MAQSSSSDNMPGRAECLAYERTRLIAEAIAAVEWALNEQEMSRADLARRMGVSPGRITQILSGSENLTVSTLTSVAIAVNGRFRVQLDFGENPQSVGQAEARPPQVPIDFVVMDNAGSRGARPRSAHGSASASFSSSNFRRSLISLMMFGKLSCRRWSRSSISASSLS